MFGEDTPVPGEDTFCLWGRHICLWGKHICVWRKHFGTFLGLRQPHRQSSLPAARSWNLLGGGGVGWVWPAPDKYYIVKNKPSYLEIYLSTKNEFKTNLACSKWSSNNGFKTNWACSKSGWKNEFKTNWACSKLSSKPVSFYRGGRRGQFFSNVADVGANFCLTWRASEAKPFKKLLKKKQKKNRKNCN